MYVNREKALSLQCMTHEGEYIMKEGKKKTERGVLFFGFYVAAIYVKDRLILSFQLRDGNFCLDFDPCVILPNVY
jgi:hypothetical protein